MNVFDKCKEKIMDYKEIYEIIQEKIKKLYDALTSIDMNNSECKNNINTIEKALYTPIKVPDYKEYYDALQASNIDSIPNASDINKTKQILSKYVELEGQYHLKKFEENKKTGHYLIAKNI